MSLSSDVAVVGLGGMGSAAAAHLAQRGLSVVGLERFSPVHAMGSSHGRSRVIRQAYFEGADYVPLLRRAYELTERLGADVGRELLHLVGGLFVGAESSRTVAGSRASAVEHDIAHELLDAAELRRRFPVLRPAPDDVALLEPGAGYVVPEDVVAAHHEVAERAGADLRFSTAVTSWRADPSGEGVELRTSGGTVRAGRLVLAPGAWAPRLLAGLGLPLVVERQVLGWFGPTGGVEPFLPGRLPIWIWEVPDGRQPYGFPALEAPERGVKVALFRGGPPCDPETVARDAGAADVAPILDALGERVAGLPGELLGATACLYTTTPDEHFVIGAHPEHPQVTVACGFSGHGFKFTPVIGELVTDLVADGATAHPIGLFGPCRPALGARDERIRPQ